MRVLQLILPLCLAVVLVGAANAYEDPPTMEKIVGTWESTEMVKGDPSSLIIVFDKDGQFTCTSKITGTTKSWKGTYSLEGHIVTMTNTSDKNKSVMTVKKLTNDALLLEAEKKGDKLEFKKKN